MDINFRISNLKEDGTHELNRERKNEKIPIGKMPVMVKSQYCMLNNLSPEELINVGECYYD